MVSTPRFACTGGQLLPGLTSVSKSARRSWSATPLFTSGGIQPLCVIDRDPNKDDESSTVLIPIDAADPEELSAGLIATLAPVRIVLLGYYLVPNQSAPDQMRSDREDEATAAVADAVSEIDNQDANIESLVVFTHDKDETIDHAGAEHNVDAVLTPGEYPETLSRVLVPMRGDVNLEGILSFVIDVMRQSEVTAKLYNIAEADDEASRGELLLRGARDRLADSGVDPDRVTLQVDMGDSPADAIIAAAEAADLVVLGGAHPSLRDRILGGTTSRVIANVERPVLTVQDL